MLIFISYEFYKISNTFVDNKSLIEEKADEKIQFFVNKIDNEKYENDDNHDIIDLTI